MSQPRTEVGVFLQDLEQLCEYLVQEGRLQDSKRRLLVKNAQKHLPKTLSMNDVLRGMIAQGCMQLQRGESEQVLLDRWREDGKTIRMDRAEAPTVSSAIGGSGRTQAESLAGVVLKAPPSADALPATIGPYQIEKVLGKGGMGAVYLGKHRVSMRLAAIKTILPDQVDKEMRERFRREAIAVCRVDHPNVVTGYDVVLDAKPPYIAMALVDGVHLDLHMARLFNKGIVSRLQCLRDVCRGVQALHQAGFVHRDLKPANVLVDGKGRPFVSDLGAVKYAGDVEQRKTKPVDVNASPDLTQPGMVVGTPMYMAPEQVTESWPVTPATDVYALGKIIFNALTGKHVHQPKSTVEMLATLSAETSVPPVVSRELAAVITDDEDRDRLITIVSTCLQADPQKRYQNAGELEQAIESHLIWHEDRERRRAEEALQQQRAAAATIQHQAKRLRFQLGVIIASVFLVACLSLTALGFYRAHQAEFLAKQEVEARATDHRKCVRAQAELREEIAKRDSELLRFKRGH